MSVSGLRSAVEPRASIDRQLVCAKAPINCPLFNGCFGRMPCPFPRSCGVLVRLESPSVRRPGRMHRCSDASIESQRVVEPSSGAFRFNWPQVSLTLRYSRSEDGSRFRQKNSLRDVNNRIGRRSNAIEVNTTPLMIVKCQAGMVKIQ
jgi:hypothetical protein